MRFLIRRLGFYLVATWIAITLNFVIPRLMPGDPVEQLFARTKQEANAQSLAAMRAAFGVDTDTSWLSQK